MGWPPQWRPLWAYSPFFPYPANLSRYTKANREGKAWGTSEARQMLEPAIEHGEGGAFLRLTPEQYARLRRP